MPAAQWVESKYISCWGVFRNVWRCMFSKKSRDVHLGGLRPICLMAGMMRQSTMSYHANVLPFLIEPGS